MLVLLANPSMAFLEILMSNRIIGMIIGNPRMAISVPLFEALDAMLEIIVNEVENPMEPKSRLIINRPISSTGFPNNIV